MCIRDRRSSAPNIRLFHGRSRFYNVYESLKAVLLYLQATGSPISSTMLNIMHQVDQMAFNNTRLLMDLIKYQLPPFDRTPTKMQDNPSSVVLPVVSITVPYNNSVSTSCACWRKICFFIASSSWKYCNSSWTAYVHCWTAMSLYNGCLLKSQS